MAGTIITCGKCGVGHPESHYHPKKANTSLTKHCQGCRDRARVHTQTFQQRRRRGQVARVECKACHTVKAVRAFPKRAGDEVLEAICFPCSKRKRVQIGEGSNGRQQASLKPPPIRKTLAPHPRILELQDDCKDDPKPDAKGKAVAFLLPSGSDDSDEESESNSDDPVRPTRAVKRKADASDDSDKESDSSRNDCDSISTSDSLFRGKSPPPLSGQSGSAVDTDDANESDDSFDDSHWQAARLAWEERGSPSHLATAGVPSAADVKQVPGQLPKERYGRVLSWLRTEKIPRCFEDYAKLMRGTVDDQDPWLDHSEHAHGLMANVAQDYRKHCQSLGRSAAYFPATDLLLNSFFNTPRPKGQRSPGRFDFLCLRDWHRLYGLDTSGFKAYFEMRSRREQDEYESVPLPNSPLSADLQRYTLPPRIYPRQSFSKM